VALHGARQLLTAAEHLGVPVSCFAREWPDPLSKQFADQAFPALLKVLLALALWEPCHAMQEFGLVDSRDRHRSLELEPQRTVRWRRQQRDQRNPA